MNIWQRLLNIWRCLFSFQFPPSIHSKGKFGMTQTEFEQHVNFMLENTSLLCQTHYTDCCGFYAFFYCWIHKEPDLFKQFIYALYHYESARYNGRDYIVRAEIKAALEKGLRSDPTQDWGILNKKLPHNAEMLIALMLADTFSFLPFYYEPYSNEKHFENKAIWAGMSMASQERLLHSFGFEINSIGNDFVETNIFPFDDEERSLLRASLDQQKKILMLVNSWMMIPGCIDPFPANYTPRPDPGFPVNGLVGTHWIVLLSYSQNNSVFWDYGSPNGRNYAGDLLNCTAGFIVLS